MSYDPAIHHRRSIRLKGHDYAGGGVYFVTLCAHREVGDVFAPPDVREMVVKEWENAAGAGLVPAQNERGTHEGCPYVVMPDHFHALVRIPVGAGLVPARSLGNIIGAFKSRVVHEYIAGVKAGLWPRFSGKIWHRNYYETIVRSEEAEQRIAEYIRMNPWRCVQEFGGGGGAQPLCHRACRCAFYTPCCTRRNVGTSLKRIIKGGLCLQPKLEIRISKSETIGINKKQ